MTGWTVGVCIKRVGEAKFMMGGNGRGLLPIVFIFSRTKIRIRLNPGNLTADRNPMA